MQTPLIPQKLSQIRKEHFFKFSKFQNKAIFLSHTTPKIIRNLEETERKVKENLITAKTGRSEKWHHGRLPACEGWWT